MENDKDVIINVIVTYDKAEYSLRLRLSKEAAIIGPTASEWVFDDFISKIKRHIGATLKWPKCFHFLKLDERENKVSFDRRADDYLDFIRNKEENRKKLVWECACRQEFDLRKELIESMKFHIDELGCLVFIFPNPYRMDTNYIKKWPPVKGKVRLRGI